MKMSAMRQTVSLVNLLCRICGQEDKNCTPVFSENGRKHQIQMKIHESRLPLVVEETDSLPKQICISCINKLDIAWELHQLCAKGRKIILDKLSTGSHMPDNESQLSLIPEENKENVFIQKKQFTLLQECTMKTLTKNKNKNNNRPKIKKMKKKQNKSKKKQGSVSGGLFTTVQNQENISFLSGGFFTTVENQENIYFLVDDDGEDTLCRICNLEVTHQHCGVQCDGECKKWHHIQCINMSLRQYKQMVYSNNSLEWKCDKCRSHVTVDYINTIDERLTHLSENNPVSIGSSAIITLNPKTPSPPPPTIQVVPTPLVSYVEPPSVSSPPVNEEVYPQGLIQVMPESNPVLYQQRSEMTSHKVSSKPAPASRKSVPPPKLDATPRQIPVPKPLPLSSSRRNAQPLSRQASRNGETSNGPPSKRLLQLCKYCNRSFPDDIIDHHVSLHLRQSFSTCLECGKNFRSEQAMAKHKCRTSDVDVSNISIELDED